MRKLLKRAGRGLRDALPIVLGAALSAVGGIEGLALGVACYIVGTLDGMDTVGGSNGAQ